MRSSGCDGATGTSTHTDYLLRGAGRASRAAPWKSQPRPQQADARSISTPTPNTSSPDGVAGNNATDTPSESTIRSSRTNTANPSIPNRSANSSTAKRSAADCRESGSTTCDTPTRHYSSQPANPSKSCPNASAMPTPASRWRPINTCSQAWAQRPQPTSPPCSPPQVANATRQSRRGVAWWSVDDLPDQRREPAGQRLEVARSGRRTR